MKKKILFGLLILSLIAVPLFAAACEEEVTPPAEEEEEEGPPAEEEGEGDWWDEFGEPQYGETITYRYGSFAPTWDTTSFIGCEFQCFFECLFTGDWTLDRDTWDFRTDFIPEKYDVGLLAKSWEWTDPQTLTIHIREGVTWQDKPPVNGREFTAYDVQEHYDRMMGTGSGYTEPMPMYISWMEPWEKVTATDDHTVVFEFKHPSAVGFWNLAFPIPLNRIEAPEAVEMEGGALTDWTKAVGTGPWMLENYVAGSEITFSKNPDYWGSDPRHPENQVPYAKNLRILLISDLATSVAGLRSGQIDVLGGETSMALSWEQAQSLQNTNPELMLASMPNTALALTVRVDKAPFTDIRVRKAMQMSLNREEIAAEYYHGDVDGIPGGMFHPSMEGYAYAYEDWPQELKDEYAYNPTLAIELLAEAAAEGAFEPNELGGFDTSVIASNNLDLTLLQVFQSYLKEIGIKMDITAMDQGSFMAMATAGEHEQMAWWNICSPNLVSYKDFTSGSPMNLARATDSAYDELVHNVDFASNEAELQQWAVELDKYFLAQHWVITACPAVGYTLWQPYLKGYSGEQLHSTLEQIFARCWIDLSLKESLR